MIWSPTTRFYSYRFCDLRNEMNTWEYTMVGRGHYLAEIEGVEGILLEEESLVLDKGRERQADGQEPAQILDR